MSSRKDKKEALRQERLAREQAAAEAAKRKRLVGIGAAGILVLAAVVAVAIAVLGGGDDDGTSTAASAGGGGAEISYPDDPPAIPDARVFNLKRAAAAANCEVVDPPNEGSDHTTADVSYEANPPTSGDHHPQPAEDGAYTERPGMNHIVHSLEHGRIVIQFPPTLAPEKIGQLKALYDEDSYHMILTPNADLPEGMEVAVTTWDHALTCSEITNDTFDAIRAFKDAYRDKGPEFVP